jgi:hypothetical protein
MYIRVDAVDRIDTSSCIVECLPVLACKFKFLCDVNVTVRMCSNLSNMDSAQVQPFDLFALEPR